MPQIVFKEKPLTSLLKERQATMQHMPPQSYLQLHVPLAWILPQCLSARTSAVITLWVSDHHMVVMKSSGELLSLLIDYISSWQFNDPLQEMISHEHTSIKYIAAHPNPLSIVHFFSTRYNPMPAQKSVMDPNLTSKASPPLQSSCQLHLLPHQLHACSETMHMPHTSI